MLLFDDLDEKPLDAEDIGNLHDYKSKEDQNFSIEQQYALLQHQNTFNNLPPPVYQETDKPTHEVIKGELVPLKKR